MNKETAEQKNLEFCSQAILGNGKIYFYRQPKARKGQNDFIPWELDCSGEEFVIRVEGIGETSFTYPDRTQTKLILDTARWMCKELVWTYAEKLRNGLERIHSVANAISVIPK